MAMVRSLPLWKKNRQQHKKVVLFVETTLQLRCRKLTFTAVGQIKTEGIEAHEQNPLTEAPHILNVLHQRATRPDSSTYISLLQECVNKNALPEGKLVHARMIQAGFDSEIFLKTKLLFMYAKCGSLMDARRVFDEIAQQNVVSWTTMIAACARQGHNEAALDLFYQMQLEGIRPNQFTFTSVLLACANLAALHDGQRVHSDVIRSGFQSDIFVERALVDMYVKCARVKDAYHVFDIMSERNAVSWTVMIVGYAHNGHVEEALKLFEKMPERDVVSWTAMIAAYLNYGCNEQALTLFYEMRRTVIRPNQFTFGNVLPACANLASLEHGKLVHGDIIKHGFQSDIFVERGILDMYIKCGSIESARKVSNKMSEQNLVSWNAIIAGYAQNGHINQSTNLFRKMPLRNVVSWNTMIAEYGQNGHVEEALKLFQKMPEEDVVSWSAMIAAYVRHGCDEEALTLFYQMQQRGIKPNQFTFCSLLPACAKLAALEHGKKLHEDIIGSGFQSDGFVERSLVDMYIKSGSMDDARLVFDKMSERNVVSWTAIIGGYAQNGHIDEALKLFQKMPERNTVSWNTMIAGYAQNGHVDKVLKLFWRMHEPNVVSWNVMIAGYAQNGCVDECLKFFQKMPERDVVSWTTMIAGYEQNGHFSEALKVFRQMQLSCVNPDVVTFISVLPACSNLAVLRQGKEVHESIVRRGFQLEISVGSALVDMYAKCGSIDDAREVFDQMLERNVVSWNAMIVGYAMHGCGKEALRVFQQMQHSGTKPNNVTFIGVLAACCHAGLVDDGCQYFNCMSGYYHITPAVEHYCCMVDLLGRAGCLDEAHDFIKKMPIKPNAAVWGALLGACGIHANIELGECVAEHLLELEPKNAACYVLLSNIYAVVGRWDGVEKMRRMMKERRVKKSPGCSWIEVNNKLYSFVARDRSHPETQKIYAELERLTRQMEEIGYVPVRNLELHDVEEQQKELIPNYHSEKLPIAFGPHIPWYSSPYHQEPLSVG